MNLLFRCYRMIFREMKSSLRGGSITLFSGLMVANALAYGYHMFMARVLSPADYGVLVTLTSISYVLAVLARTFQAWIIKAVCTTPDTNVEQIHTVFKAAMCTVIPLGSVIFAGHWLASRWLADFLRLETAVPIIVLGFYAFTSFLIPVPRGLLLGLNRFHLAGMIYSLEAVARLLAATVLVTWGLGVNGALASYAIGDLLAFVIALVPLWPRLRGHYEGTPLTNKLPALDRYAFGILMTNLLLTVMASIDQIAVKHFFSEQVAGNYAVAFLLGRIIVMSTMALGWTMFARAASVPLNDRRQVRLFIKGLLVTGFIAIALTIGYLVSPTLAAHLMAGAQYKTADAYVGLVAIEMSLFALVYIQVYYLMAVKQMQMIWPLLLAFAVELVLLANYHATVEHILMNLIFVMSTLLICISALSWFTLRTNSSLVTSSVRQTPQPATDIG